MCGNDALEMGSWSTIWVVGIKNFEFSQTDTVFEKAHLFAAYYDMAHDARSNIYLFERTSGKGGPGYIEAIFESAE